jgi:hypothetical protein
MISKIRSYILTAAAGLIFMLSALVPATAMAANCNDSNAPTSATTNQCLCTGSNFDFQGTSACPDAQGGVGNIIRTIVNILSVLIGAIAVIMIIIGGFRYITSGGKQESVGNAKNTILYAIIGLVIVALAQIIVHFVLNNTAKISG